MPQSEEHLVVLFEVVATSRQVIALLQDKIASSFDGTVTLTTEEAKATESMLRIDTNLVTQLFEQNSEILDHAQALLTKLKA